MIDVDATLIGAHTEKEGAAVNFKGGFGFHPLLAYLDDSREALAGMLRAGNAGAHSAADQIALLDDALEQLPRAVIAGADSTAVEVERVLIPRKLQIRAPTVVGRPSVRRCLHSSAHSGRFASSSTPPRGP